MIYESRAVNFACNVMIAGTIIAGLIGFPIYFAVCVVVILKDRRALAMLKGDG